MAPAVYVTLHIFAYNTVFTLLVRRARARGQMNRRVIVVLALGQIACDMTAVTALVHHTGGVENYFVILVLLPMVIASELLPQGLAYATAAGASVLINALAWGEYHGVLRHVHVDLASGSDGSVAQGLHTDWMYVLQVTAALSVMSFAMVFIASAISKRLRLRERELEEAYRRLARTDEAKSFFMRKAGHEMRAPLAAIHSILEAITHTVTSLPGPQGRLIGRAQKRMGGLMELLDDLRRYSRLRSPEGVVTFQPIHIEPIVRGTVELFRLRAQEAGLEMRLIGTAPLAVVHGDEELLREMATNLVANAIQYTPSGGSIDVHLSPRRREVIVSVTDTGIGISPADSKDLFNEFFRTMEARKVLPEGTGLGLAITRQIVRMHGGEI